MIRRPPRSPLFPFFFFKDTATTEIYTLSLHDALPICSRVRRSRRTRKTTYATTNHNHAARSEEHTSELQSLRHLVCRLLLEINIMLPKQSLVTLTQNTIKKLDDVIVKELPDLFLMIRRPTTSTLLPYTTLFRS